MSLKEDIKSFVKVEDKVDKNNHNNDDVMSDMRYVCQSCSLITSALQRGCDVLQLPNGDVIITELKPVTFQYTWDEKKGKLIRTQSGVKLRKTKSQDNIGNDISTNVKNKYNKELETTS